LTFLDPARYFDIEILDIGAFGTVEEETEREQEEAPVRKLLRQRTDVKEMHMRSRLEASNLR
jgi:hypothetical protein